VKCGRCGCAYTGEIKKGQYVYYHRTEHKGPCSNTCVREEDLMKLFGEAVRRIHTPSELAENVAKVLRESQGEETKRSSCARP
jgi:hypothetical protein